MTGEKADTRRRYSAMKKALIVTECDEPGTSVAKVAMAHGINANVVHRWRQLAREGKMAAPAKVGEFVALPLAVPPPALVTPADIRLELQRGSLTMTITWPASAAAGLAAWTRELLR